MRILNGISREKRKQHLFSFIKYVFSLEYELQYKLLKTMYYTQCSSVKYYILLVFYTYKIFYYNFMVERNFRNSKFIILSGNLRNVDIKINVIPVNIIHLNQFLFFNLPYHLLQPL